MIEIGKQLPAGSFSTMGADGPETVSTAELFDGKKVVIFGVPGAFTPTCTAAHLPGFVANLDAIKARGVDTIACLSVNDVFVMHHWSQSQNAEHIMMLADGNADYVSALGLQRDMRDRGFGIRSERFAMIVDDGTVTYVTKEEVPKEFKLTSAEAILQKL